jgi:hypothetical protein
VQLNLDSFIPPPGERRCLPGRTFEQRSNRLGSNVQSTSPRCLGIRLARSQVATRREVLLGKEDLPDAIHTSSKDQHAEDPQPMKKKATTRQAKASSRQSTLNFPTSSEADLVAESPAAEISTKSGAKNRRKRTADFADDTDKHNETNGDSSVPLSSAPTERNTIAQGKKRSAAALGQHPSITGRPEGATEPSSSAKNRGNRTTDDADKHNETNSDSSVSVFSAPTERNKIAQGKKRSAAALGQHPSITESPEGATEPSSSAKNRGKRTSDFADDADKHNESHCDSSAISAQSAVKTKGSSGNFVATEFEV